MLSTIRRWFRYTVRVGGADYPCTTERETEHAVLYLGLRHPGETLVLLDQGRVLGEWTTTVTPPTSPSPRGPS